MLKMFNQIYKKVLSENISTEKNFPIAFEHRPVEVYECLKDVMKVPKEFGAWPSLQHGKSFYVAPLREHHVQRIGSKIGINEIVILRWSSREIWRSTPVLRWVSYDFTLPDFKPLIDNGFVQKLENINPAEEFIIDYLTDNLFNMWKAPVNINFEGSKNDKDLQELMSACKETHGRRAFVGSDLEDLISL